MANAIIELNNGKYELNKSMRKDYVEMNKQYKMIKEKLDAFNEILTEAMQQYGILKMDSDDLAVTYVAPQKREQFDKKAFQEDNPDLYDGYVKFIETKPSIRVKVK